jgi:hypothetical protein
MTTSAPRPYRLMPSQPSSVWVALEAVLRPVASSEQVIRHPEGHTASSQQEILPRPTRRWTEDDLRIFAEEDELDPERAQRLRGFFQVE